MHSKLDYRHVCMIARFNSSCNELQFHIRQTARSTEYGSILMNAPIVFFLMRLISKSIWKLSRMKWPFGVYVYDFVV